MISSQRRGLTYSVFKGKKNIGVDDLGFPVTGDVIRIVPVIIGSKKRVYCKQFWGLYWSLSVWLSATFRVVRYQPLDMRPLNSVPR